MSEELKRCPWCLNDSIETVEVTGLAIRCRTCGARGPSKLTEAEAIAVWNTRPQPAVSGDVVERVAQAISNHTYATTVGHSDCLEWEGMREADRNTYRRAARAALAAMQPQTEKSNG